MIMGAGKCEICWAAWKFQQELMLPSWVWRQNSFLLREPQFFLLRSSADWMRPTHLMEGNLLYLKSDDLNVNQS